MGLLWDALGEAVRLLTGGDPDTWEIILRSLQISLCATAIAFAQQGVVPPRPLTHDLIKNLLEALDRPLREVRISEVRDGVFYADLVFDAGVEVSARTSDSIALALRTGAKVLVDGSILDEAAIVVSSDEDDEVEKFKEFLDNVSAEDFEAPEGGAEGQPGDRTS